MITKEKEKEIENLENFIEKEYSVPNLYKIYNSENYTPYVINKSGVIIGLILGLIIIVFGLFKYMPYVTVFGIFTLTLFGYILGQRNGYQEGSEEGIRDGFSTGQIRIQLEILLRLIKTTQNNIEEPEKYTIGFIVYNLKREFRDRRIAHDSEYRKTGSEILDIIESVECEYPDPFILPD